MANRVAFGNRAGVHGIYVSKPGVNVLTASAENLMMSTSAKNLQIVQRGSFSASGNEFTNISWSPLGFRPIVLWASQRDVRFTYLSDNSAEIYSTNMFINWPLAGAPSFDNTVYWLVLSEEL